MFASVDIGGAMTGCAVATGAGQMVAERTIPTLAHEGPDAVLNRIAATVNELAAATGQRLLATGVAAGEWTALHSPLRESPPPAVQPPHALAGLPNGPRKAQ